MNLLEARATLIDLVQPQFPPELSTEELDRILARVAVPDPADPASTIYGGAALYRAAIAGLQLKQARIAHSAIDFSGDAGTYSANQLLTNLAALIREYQRLAGGTVGATPARTFSPLDPRVNYNDPYADVSSQ